MVRLLRGGRGKKIHFLKLEPLTNELFLLLPLREEDADIDIVYTENEDVRGTLWGLAINIRVSDLYPNLESEQQNQTHQNFVHRKLTKMIKILKNVLKNTIVEDPNSERQIQTSAGSNIYLKSITIKLCLS